MSSVWILWQPLRTEPFQHKHTPHARLHVQPYTYQSKYMCNLARTCQTLQTNIYECFALCLRFSCWQNLLADVFFYIKDFGNRCHPATFAHFVVELFHFVVGCFLFGWNSCFTLWQRSYINVNIFLIFETAIFIKFLLVQPELCHHSPFIDCI